MYHLAARYIAANAYEDIGGLVKDNIEFGTELLEAMKANNINHFVNTGTAAQHYENEAYNPMNLYAATKAFVYSYSRALREELRDTGIAVTTICPGWIKTALLPDSLNGHKVKFPLLVTADKVAAKAIRDARRGKALSIYRFAVRYVSWLQRHYPTGISVRVWANSVKKYLE